MPRYCITGGIGSGKSYVCKILARQGIKIYDCDSMAKKLMNSSQALKDGLTRLIGSNAYIGNQLNKPVVAQYLLTSEDNKQAINAIVHPAVMQDFLDSDYQWMECAILYEANLERYADKVIAVTAPKEVRLERIMKRDNINRQQAEEWIEKQMPQDIVERKADYVIVNDGKEDVEAQTLALLTQLTKTKK